MSDLYKKCDSSQEWRVMGPGLFPLISSSILCCCCFFFSNNSIFLFEYKGRGGLNFSIFSLCIPANKTQGLTQVWRTASRDIAFHASAVSDSDFPSISSYSVT